MAAAGRRWRPKVTARFMLVSLAPLSAAYRCQRMVLQAAYRESTPAQRPLQVSDSHAYSNWGSPLFT